VYNANLRQIGSGDTMSARYLPLGLWEFGTLKLDPIARWVARGHLLTANLKVAPPADVAVMPPSYWIVRGRDQHLVSFYPVVAPLLVAPLYLPAVAYLNTHGWQQPDVDRVAEVMEKLSASLLAALASVVMYVALRRDGIRWSFVLALAFACGTNTWMISSQALWQHGAGELLIALALLLGISPATRRNAAALGAVCVLIAANRPPDALIAGAIVLHAMWTRRRTVPWLLAGGIVLFAPLLFYNLNVAGSVAGGYGQAKIPGGASVLTLFQNSIWKGIAGLLVSPTRGLLIFSPFLVFVPLGLRERLRNPTTRGLAIALSIAVLAQLILYSLTDWRGGTSWGPRYLTDILPVLVWLLAPATLVLQALGRAFLVLAIAASIIIQGIGAFWYTGSSEGIIFGGDPTSMRAAWDFKNLPFLVELRHPPARGELQCNTATAIDSIGGKRPYPAGPTPLLAPGSVIEGWALGCGRTPAELFLLIDGVIIGSTQHFISRSDVNLTMHTKSASGWSVAVDTRGVSPGEHVLQLALRLEPVPTSQPRIVREQRVLVAASASGPAQTLASPARLSDMADRAESALRASQSEAGFWLTSHTIRPQFEKPLVEMNTFLTAIMIDFLSPIAHRHGLDDSVERARRHLAAQVESNGLVRYHGLPDAPTINKLGYVITPDADDTALAWRITGNASDARWNPMLKQLAAYRDSRGLYRTWLAPQEQYQSLNPGRDPNPADATIQMHIYLMLRELDPPAAKNLCATLQRFINEDDLWVYYAKAPLIPYLRSAELRQKDCAIPLPEDRLSQGIAGQEIWTEVARRLVATLDAPPGSSDKEAIRTLLTKIGRDDFAELRRTPPLLYHNDLTASVSRYYWSPDFGYALWLRLYNLVREEAVTAP
jgi:hypothetical protein